MTLPAISGTALAGNLLSWMLQTLVIATVAAVLPIVFRIRHPRTQLLYCHSALALCLMLPFIQPLAYRAPAYASFVPPGRLVLGILAAGVTMQLCWILAGLWKIRRSRIAAIPLYPVPEAMQAASAITHANALFCISGDATGPVMLGWLAPVVLLPESFLALGEEAQCGIACHELLHVKRGDWLVTLIENFAGALMWFNPGVWLLLSEASLAREQLVDGESVRLTASREPYIDALLAIARGKASPDLLPAPLFLRRRHLTQRMQSLLSDASVSVPRLLGSYSFVAAILAGSAWLACSSFPMLGQLAVRPVVQQASQAPAAVRTVPAPAAAVVPTAAAPEPKPRAALPAPDIMLPAVMDPYEPVSGAVEVPSTPDARVAALSMLNRAMRNGLRHAPGIPPFRFSVALIAAGNVLDTGQGELTETWMTGQKFSWTVNLGSTSHTRIQYQGRQYEDRHVAVIPMRAHMMRNEIFWAISGSGRDTRIRTAKIQWQGKPATCILTAPAGGDAAHDNVPGRLWDEEEYCFDDASGALLVHSIAPGTYALFDYSANVQFHAFQIPGRIMIYVAGMLAADATFNITDATAADEDSVTPGAGMTTMPPPVRLGNVFKTSIVFPGNTAGSAPQPMIVHAEIDGTGKVVEAELSAGADAPLTKSALDRIRNLNFGYTGSERQAYIDVRFIPAAQ